MEIKIHKDDIVWSYLGNFFQYFTSIIILPIVLSSLTKGELGLWYTFASIGILATYLDFGFSTTLVRNITYAWSGAKIIKKKGIDKIEADSEIDILFLDQIIFTCRLVCLVVAVFALVLMLLCGIPYVIYISEGSVNLNDAITSWIIYAFGVFLNIYYNYCSNTLRGIGLISESQKIIVLARIIQIAITYIGIKQGFGLIALSVAYLISGFIIRILSKIYLSKEIKKLPTYNIFHSVKISIKNKLSKSFEIFKTIWYNAKRSGIIALCTYATNQSLILICSAYVGVQETASYGLCLQLITAILSSAGIMFSTYSPRMINCIATNNNTGYTKVFSFCIFIFWTISILGIISFALVSTPVLAAIHSNTTIPIPMFLFMGLYVFLDHNHGEFTAYFTMRNDICYLSSYIISSLAIVIFSWLFAYWGYGIYSLMIIHFLIQISYNNWIWPYRAMKHMNVSIKKIFIIGIGESSNIRRRCLHKV